MFDTPTLASPSRPRPALAVAAGEVHHRPDILGIHHLQQVRRRQNQVRLFAFRIAPTEMRMDV